MRALARVLTTEAWVEVTWRQGNQGPQTNRFACLALWAANDWRSGPQPQRSEETLLIEWPEGAPEPTRYRLAQTGAGALSLPALVVAAKARWCVERGNRELRTNWAWTTSRAAPGWVDVTTAFAFLREEQLRRVARGTQKRPLPTLPEMRRLLQTILICWSGRCPWCRTLFERPCTT